MTFTEIIAKYWGFTLFILGLCFHAIWTYFRVDTLETKVKMLELGKENMDKMISDIKSEIASINSKLDILLDAYKRK